jgi:hypothetical protein
MRKSVLITSAVVLAICLWLLLHRRTESSDELGTQTAVAMTTNQNPVAVPKAAVPAPAPNAPAPIAVASATSMQATNAANTINPTIAEAWQKPIDFYGKVVDENTNPVAGASVEFRWDDLTANDWTRTATTTSDAEGLFSLHGEHGATLAVSVSKVDYYASQKDTNSFHYAVPNDNQIYSPDQLSPAVFHLWKKGQGAELVTSQNGMRPDLAVRVPINGDLVSVDLLAKKVVANGDLELSQIKPDRLNLQQATNWSFHISIPTGGFVEEDDAFPFTAPATTYQPAIDFNFVKGEPDWVTQFTKTYYIEFGQPAKYGWLQIDANISQQTVFLRYAINPTGSQNLEPAQ